MVFLSFFHESNLSGPPINRLKWCCCCLGDQVGSFHDKNAKKSCDTVTLITQRPERVKHKKITAFHKKSRMTLLLKCQIKKKECPLLHTTPPPPLRQLLRLLPEGGGVGWLILLLGSQAKWRTTTHHHRVLLLKGRCKKNIT